MKCFLQIILAILITVVSTESFVAAKVYADTTTKKTKSIDTSNLKSKTNSPTLIMSYADTTKVSVPVVKISFKDTLIQTIELVSFNDVILMVICFILGVIAIYFLLRRQIGYILSEEKDKYLREIRTSHRFSILYLVPLIKMLKEQKDKYKQGINQQEKKSDYESRRAYEFENKVKELSNKIHDLERKNAELDYMLKNASVQKKEPIKKIPDTNFVKSMENVIPKEVFISTYFGIPERNGNFHLEKGGNFLDDKKYYKVVYKENSATGELHFISGPFDLKVIDNIDYYLMPVCEVANILDRNNATKVIQSAPGIVHKEDEKWVISKKAKVKLI